MLARRLGSAATAARAALTTLALAVAGCGPSVQVLHEGSVRFEHCYRLDLDPAIAPSHRRACWQAWQERYSYGQSRDRLEYADRRLDSIERGDPPTGLKLESGPPQAAMAEGPIDAHAPPPPVARPVDGVTPYDEDPTAKTRQIETSGKAPGDACAQACKEARRGCIPTCTPEKPEECGCETTYRACMVSCFQ